jgi:hypothetical protein
MSRVAVILQPSYLPWLGYFAQFHRSDVFVVYDDVQFDKESWRNRNRIKTASGPQWLTVPVLTSGQQWPSNRDIRIDNSGPWRRKHLHSLRQNYAKAPYYEDYMPLLTELYDRRWEFLIDLNMASLHLMLTLLGMRGEIRLASELGVAGRRLERLIGICHAVGADAYYNGSAGRDYIDDGAFTSANITLEFQNYSHPTYPQLFPPFVPYLSTVDLIFNCGPASRGIVVGRPAVAAAAA